MPACPACGGPQLPDHPAGPLAIQHVVTCVLLKREDSRRMADVQTCVNRIRPAFYRATTDVEHALLVAVGTPVPPGTECLVQLVTDTIPRRTWPSAVSTT